MIKILLVLISINVLVQADVQCVKHYVDCHKSFDKLKGLTKVSSILKEIDIIEEHSIGILEHCEGGNSLWYGGRYLRFTDEAKDIFVKRKKTERKRNVKNNEQQGKIIPSNTIIKS